LELISGFGTKLMQEHKTARMAQELQSLASGALLGQITILSGCKAGIWRISDNVHQSQVRN
jgi:hypothetical protein